MLFSVLSLLAFSFKFWIPSLLEIAKRLSAIFLLTFKFAAYASFPWKLNRYSYGVQFGINCTALDQSKLSNFVECNMINERLKWSSHLIGQIEQLSLLTHEKFRCLQKDPSVTRTSNTYINHKNYNFLDYDWFKKPNFH